ncbi:MAG: J domain-containing protein [Nanoarchaeota archaeon]|nr:J domain-containing protein [Nanoarchaeota archaeon]
MKKIKGYEFKEIVVKNSYNRRALQYKNQIINNLKVFGLTEDDVEIPLEAIAIKKAMASAEWYQENRHLFFSYNGSSKFVENLGMVMQVIGHLTTLLTKGVITLDEFFDQFEEKKDVIEQRVNAREILGISEDSIDFETIHKNYKKLSKEFHPDMHNGDTEKFKKINVAHAILKRELC